MADFLPFEAKFARAWPPSRWNDVTTMVGLSGGADSVALLMALCAVKGNSAGRLVAAHFNHGWRGAESDEDEQFCRELAKRLGIEFLVGAVTPQEGETPKTEEAARHDRYTFFRQAAESVAARYLVLAHHRDDQVETVLQRAIRGTSLRGLAGMSRLRSLSGLTTVVRPLLWCSRRAIEKYLNQLGQHYRVDSTNANPAWLRNRIRGELIPLLESKYAHQTSRSIARLAAESAEAVAFLDELADEAMTGRVRLDVKAGQATLINLDALKPYLLRLVLVRTWQAMNWPVGEMTRKHWRKLAEDLLANKNGSLGQYPGAIHVASVDGVVAMRKL